MEEKLREENKSLWQRVYDATVGLIKKIIAFKDMLLSILAKAAGVIGDIISDPIGFLGNLVDGVMLGLKNFMGNIGAHLKKGLMDWLFGALAGAGLSAARHLRPQGHRQHRPAGARADLRQLPRPGRGDRRRAGRGRAREDRRGVQGDRHRGHPRAVAVHQGEAGRPQVDGARRHLRLHQGEGDHRRRHLGDRPAQPGLGLLQGVQGDLRHRDVLHQHAGRRSSRWSTP